MTSLIAPLLFIAAIIYIAYPLLSEAEGEPQVESAETGVDRLLDEKEELIASLKDIEMDYRMGKLSLQDYNQLRGDFERRAADVLRRLEQAEASAGRES